MLCKQMFHIEGETKATGSGGDDFLDEDKECIKGGEL